MTKRRLTAGLALLLVGAGVLAVVSFTGSDDTALQRKEVTKYAADMRPWIMQGGYIIVEDVKPALPDLGYGKLAPADFRAEAAGWKADLESVRKGMASVQVPTFLRAAAAGYNEAMLQYEAAVDGFVQASYAPADQLNSAVLAQTHLGDKADATYDKADAIVKSWQKRLGLPTPPPLPRATQ